MNFLTLPIPDEVLLEYLSPQDMISLCKTNSVYYKNFKPLIYKAVKKYYTLKYPRLMLPVYNNLESLIQDFGFVAVREDYYFGHNSIPKIIFSYSDDVDANDLFLRTEQILKILKIMREDDVFDESKFYERSFDNAGSTISLKMSHSICFNLVEMDFKIYKQCLPKKFKGFSFEFFFLKQPVLVKKFF